MGKVEIRAVFNICCLKYRPASPYSLGKNNYLRIHWNFHLTYPTPAKALKCCQRNISVLGFNFEIATEGTSIWTKSITMH